jgi:hypothetical protein
MKGIVFQESFLNVDSNGIDKLLIDEKNRDGSFKLDLHFSKLFIVCT